MAIRRGIDNAVSDAESGGKSFGRVNYWNLEKDKTEILRFLTDAPDWYVIKQHRFFPTKAAPKDANKWPKAMTAACRKDPAFADTYSSCPLCDAIKDYELKGFGGKSPMKPASMVFAIAVRREKVVGDGSEELGGAAAKGKRIIRDRLTELDELGDDGKSTGNKRTVPDIRVVSNTMYSLFGGLKAAYETFDSVVDRDFQIKREAAQTGNGTVHTAVALDSIASLKPGTERWEAYEEAVEFYGIDLEKILEDSASDEFYNRFFLGEDGKVAMTAAGIKDNHGKGSAAAASVDVADDDDEVDEEAEARLADVKRRLLNKSSEKTFA